MAISNENYSFEPEDDEFTCCDNMALAASADSLNTTNEPGRSYLAPLRLSGQKNDWKKRTENDIEK